MVFQFQQTNLPSRRWFQNKFNSETQVNIENQWFSKIKPLNQSVFSIPIHNSKDTINHITISKTIQLKISMRWASNSNIQDFSNNTVTYHTNISKTSIKMYHFQLETQATSIIKTTIKDSILKWTILNIRALDHIKTTTCQDILTIQLKAKVFSAIKAIHYREILFSEWISILLTW